MSMLGMVRQQAYPSVPPIVSPQQTIKILLIDDQPIIGEAVRQMVTPEADMTLRYLSDPTQALKVIREFSPTVILQDLVMPEMNGLLLVQFLRSKDAIARDIPLIVLSSKEEPVIKAKAFEFGANDYLVKLPDRIELIARIRYHSNAYLNLLQKQDAEAQLKAENLRQAQYIEQVEKVAAAAAAVESNTFEPGSLSDVAIREDELGKLARIFGQMVQTVQAREQELKQANEQLEALLEAYGRFVPHDYLRFLRKDSILDVRLGDNVSKVMAVMFSDIRSFTTLSENMTPRDSFEFINAYLQHVSPEIRNHRGLVVKFMGDGVMAVFPEGADDAVQGSIAQLEKVRQYNQHRETTGEFLIKIGIGLHVGHMMVGMIGEENRMQGDALSDTINLTARLEGLTKYYGVSLLISQTTFEYLSNPRQYDIRFLDRAIVKGRSEPIDVYEVLNGEPEAVRKLKLQSQATFEEGIEAYRDRRLDDARTAFARVLAINPKDTTAALYLERINHFMELGIPTDWNGVWTFTQK